MSPARIGEAAEARLLDRIEALAVEDLPADIAVERGEEGLRLTGPALAIRRVTDARLRGLALTAARRGA